MIGVAIWASAHEFPVTLSLIAFGALWYGGEMLLAAMAGWHIAAFYPLYGLTRVIILPPPYVGVFLGDDFVWRGNEMQVECLLPRRRLTVICLRIKELFANLPAKVRKLTVEYTEKRLPTAGIKSD